LPGSQLITNASSLADVAAKRDRRYARVMGFAEIEAMPRLEFSKGCESAVFVSRERDDARYFYLGMCFHGADMEDFVWEQVSWDEAFYCIKGRLCLHIRDGQDNESELFIEEGEHVYVPAGYWYTLKATGIDSLNYWIMSPSAKVGLAPMHQTGIPEAPQYAKTLRAMRDES
jgi:hypothetical protein